MSQKQRAEQRPAAPPPSHPASQVVAVCSPHARISEEQRTRWLHFPGVPKPSLGDWAPAACPGVHQPRRSQHSPQLCSTDSSCLPAVSPVCTEGRGGGGQSIRSGLCCLIPMGLPLCRSLTSEPQFPCFRESRGPWCQPRLAHRFVDASLWPMGSKVLCTLRGTSRVWLVPSAIPFPLGCW